MQQLRGTILRAKCEQRRQNRRVNGDSEVIGETRVRNHCTFRWREAIGVPDAPRLYEIEDHHCDACIAELKRITTAIFDKRSSQR